MKKLLVTIAATAAALYPLTARADYEGEVRIWQPETETYSKTAHLDTDTRITFDANGVNVLNGPKQDEVTSLPWAEVSKLTFHTSESGVQEVGVRTRTLSLRENPVGDILIVEDAPQETSRLSVYSLTGVCHIRIDRWNGSAVDVSALPSGIYLLSVNNQTLKFVKK